MPGVPIEELTIPSEEEVREAGEAAKRLSPLVARRAKRRPRRIRIRPADGDEEVVVPESAFRLFVDLLEFMSKGSAVTVVPVVTSHSDPGLNGGLEASRARGSGAARLGWPWPTARTRPALSA